MSPSWLPPFFSDKPNTASSPSAPPPAEPETTADIIKRYHRLDDFKREFHDSELFPLYDARRALYSKYLKPNKQYSDDQALEQLLKNGTQDDIDVLTDLIFQSHEACGTIPNPSQVQEPDKIRSLQRKARNLLNGGVIPPLKDTEGLEWHRKFRESCETLKTQLIEAIESREASAVEKKAKNVLAKFLPW